MRVARSRTFICAYLICVGDGGVEVSSASEAWRGFDMCGFRVNDECTRAITFTIFKSNDYDPPSSQLRTWGIKTRKHMKERRPPPFFTFLGSLAFSNDW